MSQKPLALTDDQLAAVLRAASPLLPVDRSPFLEAVAARLSECSELGDGVIGRICAEVQRKFWNPPHLGQSAGKYR